MFGLTVTACLDCLIMFDWFRLLLLLMRLFACGCLVFMGLIVYGLLVYCFEVLVIC